MKKFIYIAMFSGFLLFFLTIKTFNDKNIFSILNIPLFIVLVIVPSMLGYLTDELFKIQKNYE